MLSCVLKMLTNVLYQVKVVVDMLNTVRNYFTAGVSSVSRSSEQFTRYIAQTKR